MRGGPVVLAAAALSLLPQVAAAAVQLRALPAWEGAVAAGRVTEIRVTLRAPTDTAASLTATTPLSRVEQALQLAADEPITVTVPVRVDATGIVELELTGEGATVQRELALSLRKPGLLVTTRASERPAHALVVGVDAFAQLPQAFESIRTVVLDAVAFEAMQPAQRDALAAFAGRCGRIALVGEAPVPDVLRQAAGCDARFLAAVPSDRALAGELASLGDAAALPGPSALAALAGNDSWLGLWWTVCIFVVAYCLATSALALSGARPRTLLAASAAAVAMSLLLGVRGGSASRASWTVVDSDSEVARETTLLRVSGTGRGEVTVALGNTPALPEAVSGNGTVVRRVPGENQLVVQQQLFSVADFVFRQTRRVPAPLRLELENGQVRIFNPGTKTSPGGLLDWRGDVYAVPRLKSGATWMPGEPATAVVRDAAFRLWRRQAALLEASVLLPDAGLGDAAWLVLLPPQERPL